MAGVISYNNIKANPLYIYRATSGGTVFSSNLTSLTTFDLFTDTAVVDDAIYFSSYTTGLSAYSNLYLSIGTALSGTDVVIVWEYYCGSTATWLSLYNLTDGSSGLTITGDVVINFPAQPNHSYNVVNGVTQNWIRCRISSLTSITEGGAINGSRVQAATGQIDINGYTDSSACSWKTLCDWLITNAPEVEASYNGMVYTINNFVKININSTLRSTNEVIMLGNGCYAQYLNLDYLWSGTKIGTNGWAYSSYYFLSTKGPTNQLTLTANSRIYGGCIVTQGVSNSVNGLTCYTGGFAGLAYGDIIGVYAPYSGYFYTGNIDRCTVGGGLITAGNPTTYPSNLQISNAGGYIWGLYGNDFDCSDVSYSLPTGYILTIGASYYNLSNPRNINIKNPSPALPEQTSSVKVIGRVLGSSTNFSSVLFYDDSAGTYTDYTSDASSGASSIPINGDVNDCLYFKTNFTNQSYNSPKIAFTIPSQNNDYEYLWEYQRYGTAAWLTMGNDNNIFWDSTNNLIQSGSVWLDTNYHSVNTIVNSISGCWVRLRIVTKGTGSPVINKAVYYIQNGLGNFHINELYDVNFKILAEDETPISSADIVLTDSVGNVYSEVTDANGDVSTTIQTSLTFFDPLNSTDGNYNYTKTSYNSFTITVSKTGYETYTSNGVNIIGKISETITLKPTVPIRQLLDGKLLLANQAELGSSSKLLEV